MVRKLLILLSLSMLSVSSSAHENKKDKDHKKPQPPVATFAATQLTFVSPFKVKFDASASSSQVGPIHDYIWDFGDDSRHPHFDCQDERREHRGGAHRSIVEHAYRKPGVYRVTLKVVDKRGGHAKVYKDIRVVLPAPPIAKISVSPSASGVAPFFALLDASASSSPVGLPLTYKFTFGDGQVVTTPSAQLGHPYNLVGSYVATVRVTDSAGLFSEKSISITVTAPVIPPAPVAPPQAAAAPQSFDQRASFIYQGPNAVQTGVLPGAIKTNRVSLLRGRVLDDLNQPLSGVVITVFGQSQLGHTLSRANGEFDLAVNGGELPVTIKYNRSGYTPAQRTLKIPVLDNVAIGDVLLSRYDSKATTVQMNAAANQVHTASTVSDSDGARTATIVVKPQTTAQLIMPDGSSRAVNQLTIRATEVTVGTDGPKRMPADLPTNTGYTYAVDLTADEAIALGAKSIEFSKPVAFHLDNFLNIPVGFIVPSGYLDQAKGFWTPEIDGRVIRVLNVSAGLAQIDIYGSGQPANAQELTILGVDSDELRALASYPVGKTLWRVPIRHFSFFDFNFAQIPFGPHMENSPVASNPPCASACCATAAGCEIDIGRRVWREKIPLLGSGLDLHYSSDRTSGWFGDSVVAATLLKGVPPSQLNYIDVNTTIAGRTFKSHILKNGNMDYQLTWDGLDGFGREVTQPTTATVNLEYNFTVVYRVPLGGNLIANPPAKTFNSPWDPTAIGQTFPSRDLFIYKQTMTMDVTPPNSFLAENAKREVGGWTFAQHHQYDAVRKRLYLGTGHIVDIKALPQIVQDVAGGGANLGDGGLALGSALRLPVYYRRNADGTAYISDYGHSRIRKIGTDGVISTYAGTGVSGNTGDGGPASAAQIGAPVGILPSPDGSIYFGDATQHVVRKIDANGIISTVAGTGVAGFSGDGGPATSAQINTPLGLILMNDGSLLFADSGNHVIRQVLADGTIRTYAGTPSVSGYSGDGGPALGAKFKNPDLTFMDITQTLYITDSGNHVIRVIRPGGVVDTVAGSGAQGFSGDGGPALSANLNSPQNVVVSDRGVIYFSDSGNHVIRSVDTAGNIHTIAGKAGVAGFDGGYNAPDQTLFNFPTGLFLMPDESLYIADTFNNRIRYLSDTPTLNINGTIAVPSVDGTEIYVFDPQNGRHLSTLFGKTGTAKWNFAYNSNGFLTSLTDQDGNITQIVRDSNGLASQVIGPYGQIYALSLDANGFLRSLRQPTGETYQMTSAANGLITQFQNPRGFFSSVAYNSDGTIRQDTDPSGATKVLNYLLGKVTNTSAMGRKTVVDQVHDSYFPSQWGVVITLPDGRVQSQNSVGSLTTTQASSGTMYSQSKIDIRLGANSRFESGQLFLAGDSGFASGVAVNRAYTVRSPFDFDLQETHTKDTNFVTTMAYSSTTQTSMVTTGAGRLSRMVIDSKERPISTQMGSFTPITYVYDTRGRLSQLKQGARTTTLGYDSNGHLASATDPLGRVTGFINDVSGRMLSTTLPGGRVIQNGYDGNSNLIGLITSANFSHGMDFSPLDKLAAYRPPNLSTGATPTSYSYNLDGQLSSIARADGQAIVFQYDEPQDRLKQVGSASQYRVFSYDTKARLASAGTNSGVSIQYQYDGTLPLSKVYSATILNSASSVTYSNPGLRINSRTIGSHTVNLSYDADETLSQVDALSLTRDVQSGLITGLSLNNVHESMSYSLFAELAAKQVLYNSGSIFNESFIRDGLGRITQKSETIGGVTSVYQYSYDVSGRLTDVVKDGVNVGHYSYDLNSNRTSAMIRGSNISATYDSQDRIVSYSGVTYNFNAHGDLQSKSDGSAYSYDVFGGTTSVTKGGITISYQNDAEGHRVVRYKNGLPSGAFIYNELGQLVGEFNSSGAIVSSFHYASQSHSPDLMIKGSAKYYFVKDHLGSVRLVVNSSTGVIDQRIDYDEFGQILADSNPGFQPFGFAGGLYDPDTKLVRFGARDYDPEIGRWTSKDPILFNGGDMNLYGYVLADPVNLIDPTGNNPLIIAPIAGGLVGGAVGAITAGLLGGSARDIAGGFASGFIGGATAGLGLATGLGAGAALAAGTGASFLTALPDSGMNPTDLGNGFKHLLDPPKRSCP